MSFCALNGYVRRLCLVSFVSLGWTAAAQQNIETPQSSVFDSTNADTSSPPGLAAPDQESSHPASDFDAPRSLFDHGPSANFQPLPGAPTTVIPSANTARRQRLLDQQKNWSLMTPAQILGVTTPAEILGIADPNENSALTPEERFLQNQERLQRQAGAGATNAFSRSQTLWHNQDPNEALFHPVDGGNTVGDPKDATGDSLAGAEQRFSSLRSARPDADSTLTPKSLSAWSSPFQSLDESRKATPAQLEGMDRFRALMDPPLPAKPAVGSPSFQPVAAAVDPFMQTGPAFNPAGHTFTPLGNDITRPVGLTPLAGITGPVPARKPASRPAQAPPWMSPSSQFSTPTPMTIEGFSPPQRQF